MVKRLDGFARDVAPTTLVTSRDQFADRAYDLLTSSKAQAAFRIGDETPRCGRLTAGTTFGQSCLLARRLVQAGVSFVTINNRGAGQLQWDTHAQNFNRRSRTPWPRRSTWAWRPCSTTSSGSACSTRRW